MGDTNKRKIIIFLATITTLLVFKDDEKNSQKRAFANIKLAATKHSPEIEPEEEGLIHDNKLN